MKTKPAAWLLCLIFPVLLLPAVSCSSVPKEQQPVTGKRARANDFSDFGLRYFTEGRYDEALMFFSYALTEQVLADNREGIIDSYYNLGRTYLELGNQEEAENAFDEGLRLARMQSLPEKEARGLILSGELLLARGNADEARKGFLAAVEILLPLRNRGRKELAVAYHDLGVALKQLRSLKESESYLRMSLEINRSLQAREEEANNLYMLASVVHVQGRSEEAMELLEAALVIDRDLERSLSIAQDLFALGSVAKALGLYDKAFTSWGQSFMIYQAMELSDPAVAVLRRLARLASVRGETAAEQRYLKAAEKLEEGAIQ